MKTILLVGPFPPPYGGIASLVADLAPFLAQHGYRVRVLTLTKDKEEIVSPYPGVEVIRRRARKLHAGAFRRLPWAKHRKKLRYLEWILREVVTTEMVREMAVDQRPSLIGSYMVTSSLFIPHLKPAFGPQVKFMTTVFGELVERQDVIVDNKRFYTGILQNTDYVLATSQYCANLTRILDFDPGRVDIIYIGVDLEKFAPNGSADLQLPNGKRNVLFVGRFHNEMGLDVVLDAIPEVISQRPDVRFLLVGARGPLSAAAADVAGAFPANVHIAQDVPGSLLPSYYRASEILLAPTREKHACMGVSIKEAMACGKPIIASNSGGIPEAVVHGETGTILNAMQGGSIDPRELARATLELLEHPEQVHDMGRRARTRALQLFDNRVLLNRHLSVVERLIGTPD